MSQEISSIEKSILKAWKYRIRTEVSRVPDKLEQIIATSTSWGFRLQKVVRNVMTDSEIMQTVEGERSVLGRCIDQQVESIMVSYLNDADELYRLRSSWWSRLSFLFSPKKS